MTFKTIFFLMFGTLVVLFIVSHLTKKKSQNLSQAEAKYFEVTRLLKKSPADSQLKEQAIAAAKDYGMALGLSPADIEQMIHHDLGEA